MIQTLAPGTRRFTQSKSISPRGVGGGLIVSSRSTGESFTESRDTSRGTMRMGAAVRQSRPSAVAGSVGFAWPPCPH